MKYCSKCGTRFNDGDSFCQNCGAPFSPALGVNVNQGAQVYSEPKDYNLFTAWISMWKRAFDFKGRSRRKEYWLAAIANALFYSLAVSIIFILGIMITGATNSGGSALSYIVFAFSTIYILAALIPGLSLAVRRLHDTNRSGWWIFIALIPLIGAISLLVFYCTEGDLRPNKYGPSPK